MKIKLRLNRETEDRIALELMKRQIEISEDSELTLTEDNYHRGELRLKDDNEIVVVPLEDIYYIEALGRDVLVHTAKKLYKSDMRVYKLEQILPREDFIRISNAVIIRRNSIKKIKPALSCKFYLTLVNDDRVDVTRTYYYKFKEFYGI